MLAPVEVCVEGRQADQDHQRPPHRHLWPRTASESNAAGGSITVRVGAPPVIRRFILLVLPDVEDEAGEPD